MAISTDQYNRLLARVTALEQRINNILVAMEQMVTLTQVNQLLVVAGTEREDIYERLQAVEARMDALEQEL